MIKLSKRILWKIQEKRIKKKLVIEQRCIFEKNVQINFKNSIFEGKNRVAKNVIINNCIIGIGSYIGNNSNMQYTKIGRYCSVGPNVRIVSGSHPTTEYVSTHPAFFSIRKQAGFTYVDENRFQEFKYVDVRNELMVEIGNDVWIGDGAVILHGVKIGDGAIVAAGALVSKNVEPYSIVGGVPAKHLRFRFDAEIVEGLKEFKWWYRDEEWIKEHAYQFGNAERFLADNN